MSTKAITWALEFPAKSASEKAILLVLANYANGDGVSFPGQQSISEQAACSKRTVIRVMESLEERGIIERRQRRRSNGSRTSDEVVLVAFQQGDNLAPSEEPKCQSVQSKVTSCPMSGDTMSPPTTFEPSEDTSEEPVRARVTQADCDRFEEVYPAAGGVSYTWANLPIAMGRHVIRLGSAERVIAAARAYAEHVVKHDTKPRSVANFLGDPAFVDQWAAEAAPAASAPDTPAQWRRYVRQFTNTGAWHAPGPKPNEPGCLAPPEILAEFDFKEAA